MPVAALGQLRLGRRRRKFLPLDPDVLHLVALEPEPHVNGTGRFLVGDAVKLQRFAERDLDPVLARPFSACRWQL